MVEEAVKTAKPGQWIVGRGWHQEKWTVAPTPNVEGFPTHASLDRVSPDNPVVLTHASGHASFVNGKAMELSGIDHAARRAPHGGESAQGRERRPDRPAAREGRGADHVGRRRAVAGGAAGARRARCWSSPTAKCCRRGSPASRTPAPRSPPST